MLIVHPADINLTFMMLNKLYLNLNVGECSDRGLWGKRWGAGRVECMLLPHFLLGIFIQNREHISYSTEWSYIH